MTTTLEEFKVDLDISDILRAMSELQKATQKNADRVEDALKGIGDSAEKIGDGVNKGFKTAKQATKETKDEVTKFRESLLKNITVANLASGAISAAFGAIKAAIGASIGTALEYERSMVTQGATLRLFAANVDGASDALEKQSAALEQTTGIGQEQIRTLQNQAIALGTSVSGTDDLLKASIGLANVLGRDVNEVMRQLIKSQSGMLDETLASIPALRDLTKEQRMNGDAIKVVNEMYGDFAKLTTEGGGSAASIERLSTAWGNLFKTVGRGIMESETVKGELSFMSDWATVMTDQVEGGRLGEALGTLFFAGFDPKGIRDAAGGIRDLKQAEADAATAAVRADEAHSNMSVSVSGLSFNLKKLKERADAAKKANEGLANIYNPKEDPTAALARKRGLIEGTEEFVGPGREMMDRGTLADQSQMKYIELQSKAQTGLTEIMTENAARRQDIMWEEEEHRRQAIVKLKEQTNNMNEFLSEHGAKGMNMLAGAVSDAWTQMLSGAEVSAGAIVQTILKALGQQMIGQGFADLAKAGAYLFQPEKAALAGPLAAAAGAEIAVGSALMAGSLAGAGGKVGRRVGGGGGGGGRGGSARPSLRAPDRGRESGEFTSKGLVVVINGPTFATEAEIGVAIERARMAARQRGLTQ